MPIHELSSRTISHLFDLCYWITYLVVILYKCMGFYEANNRYQNKMCNYLKCSKNYKYQLDIIMYRFHLRYKL